MLFIAEPRALPPAPSTPVQPPPPMTAPSTPVQPPPPMTVHQSDVERREQRQEQLRRSKLIFSVYVWLYQRGIITLGKTGR